MMEKTITLAAGTQHLLVADIPMMIAEAVTPKDMVGIERITSIWKKMISDNMPNDYDMAPLEPLTAEDWVFLEKVCVLHTVPIAPHADSQTPQFEEAPLPPLRTDSVMNEIDLSEWGKYEEAIAEYKKDWKLFPRSNSALNLAASKHFQHLVKAIRDGELIVYDQSIHLPLAYSNSINRLNKGIITVDDFTCYAKKLGLTIKVNESMQTDLSNVPILGKQPNTGIGKLAIEVAWGIECSTGAAATANEVIKQLQLLVKSKDILVKTIPGGVEWMTQKKITKPFTIDACGKALKTWYESRA